MITSYQIKYVKSLQQKKYRRQENIFVAEGEKIISEIINSSWQIKQLYATESWLDNARNLPKHIKTERVIGKEMERMSGFKNPSSVLALVEMRSHNITDIQLRENLVLVLDNIQDPGNLGTIIRTADWFGIRQVVCSPATAEIYNPKVLQSSMGSFLRVSVFYTHLPQFLQSVPSGYPVMGTFTSGDIIYSLPEVYEGIIVTGNESQGISNPVMPFITKRITIPQRKSDNLSKHVESLNASVATGIILSHLTKYP